MFCRSTPHARVVLVIASLICTADQAEDAPGLSFCNLASALGSFLAMAELPKTYDPGTVEPKWYARWEEAGMFPRGREFAQAGIFDRDSAAERHRHPDPWACPQQHDPGHSRAPRPDAGLRGALAAGHRSCRRRHPDAQSRNTCAKQKTKRGTMSAAKNFSGGSSIGRTSMAASSFNSSSGSALVRLVAAALHLRR